MQAVRVERRRPLDARWLQHLLLLAALGLLFTSIAAGRTQATAELAERLPGRFLAPPSTPAQEWQPIRVPVRTQITPDPVQAAAVAAADATLAASTGASTANTSSTT